MTTTTVATPVKESVFGAIREDFTEDEKALANHVEAAVAYLVRKVKALEAKLRPADVPADVNAQKDA